MKGPVARPVARPVADVQALRHSPGPRLLTPAFGALLLQQREARVEAHDLLVHDADLVLEVALKTTSEAATEGMTESPSGLRKQPIKRACKAVLGGRRAVFHSPPQLRPVSHPERLDVNGFLAAAESND